MAVCIGGGVGEANDVILIPRDVWNATGVTK